ncbi:MAG: amidohydrolase family protein, partial [Opitutales bacterium]|nr:amidohydrolase family protein [Opitutales bacterium]
CMNSMTRRDAFKYAGCIEAGLLEENFDVEIIADGLHVPQPFLKLVLKNKSPDHVALITDSMRAAGTSAKKSVLGSLSKGREVLVEDGVAKLPDRTAFAGSVATGDRLVRTMVELAGCGVCEAVKMASQTPARIMGLQNSKGKLAAGYDADIAVFGEGVDIQYTIIGGKIAYKK